MIPQFDNDVTSSFLLFLDNRISTRGQAYTNYGSYLYQMQDKQYPSLSIYAAPFKQWVRDSSVSGANIPSGIYVSGNFVPRGQSGLKIDYDNGRVIFSGGNNFAPNSISGNYAIKDFSIVYTTSAEEDLLFNNKFFIRPKSAQQLSGVPSDLKTYPIIYVKYNEGQNVPFSFGGQDLTKAEFRAIVLADSAYLLDAAIGIMRDTAQMNFQIIPAANVPIDMYGDFKGGTGLNYTGLSAANFSQSKLMYIHEVLTSKFSEQVNTSIDRSLFGAFVDFRVWLPRYPRA